MRAASHSPARARVGHRKTLLSVVIFGGPMVRVGPVYKHRYTAYEENVVDRAVIKRADVRG